MLHDAMDAVLISSNMESELVENEVVVSVLDEEVPCRFAVDEDLALTLQANISNAHVVHSAIYVVIASRVTFDWSQIRIEQIVQRHAELLVGHHVGDVAHNDGKSLGAVFGVLQVLLLFSVEHAAHPYELAAW